MNHAICLPLCSALLVLRSTPASAHPGDHTNLGWPSLATHLIEPDHLVFIALMVVVVLGVLAFRLGPRAERRIRNRGRSR